MSNVEGPYPTADIVSSRATDEIEQALLEVRALIESTVAEHRDRSLRGRLATPLEVDDASLAAAVTELLAGAKHRVAIVVSADPARSEPVLSVIGSLLAETEDELKVRVLCTRRTLYGKGIGDGLRSDPRVELRVANLPAMEAVLVDDRAAIACADWPTGRMAAVIHAPAVFDAIQALFLSVWGKAESLSDWIDLGDSTRTGFARQILQRLHAGATDEAAARELSVSVRTYRRYVAEIMGLLGANSRFQAGVRAAELGLLPGPPAPAPARDGARVPAPRNPDRMAG